MRKILLLAAVLSLAAFVLPGCAMITGTATGAIFGLVDAPAETYRHNREFFKENPMAYAFDALIMGPIGFATGPVFGFGKGLSLDIQWVAGQVHYGDVFGSFGPMSVWRPWTFQWPPVAPNSSGDGYDASGAPRSGRQGTTSSPGSSGTDPATGTSAGPTCNVPEPPPVK